MPVLQVPAGEEGGPEGFPNLLKYWEKEEDGEEKREDKDDEEEVEGKRSAEEDIQDSQGVQEGMIVKFPLVPGCHFCSSCFKVLFNKKPFNSHNVEIPHVNPLIK